MVPRQQIQNMNAVEDAVGQLEKFPMTSEMLQSTRIGKLLNDIRKQTDDTLHSRIRRLIAAWRRLLDPNYAQQTVIPIELLPESSQKAKAPLHRAVTMTQLEHLAVSSNPVSPALSASSYRSSPGQALTRTPQTTNRPNVHHLHRHKMDVVNTNGNGKQMPHSSTPAVKLRKVDGDATDSAIKNGCRETTPLKAAPKSRRLEQPPRSPRVGESVSYAASVGSDSSAHTGTSRSRVGGHLPQVKSTMELLAEFQVSVNRETVNKILTNEIVKEPDVRPSVLPESVRPRQYRSKVVPAPQAVVEGKTEMMEKFLESAVQFGPNDSADGQRSEGEKSSATPAVSKEPSPAIKEEKDVVEDKESESEGLMKKKKRKKMKERRRLKKMPLPVTNHMDDWPTLPPIPDPLDWTSLDYTFESTSITADEENVRRLVSDVWPGVNCTLDSVGNPIKLTDLCTEPSGRSVIHILPWVALEEQRPIFPEEEVVTERTDPSTDIW